MAEYRLYCFAQSGNAYKAALMLSLCGADWEARFVDFFNGETRTPEFRQINEMGEVPVLEHRRRAEPVGRDPRLPGGPVRPLRLADEDERREILRWLLWDNHKLTSYIGTLRFLTRFMRTGETPVTEFLRGRVQGALGVLDRHLERREFAVGGRPTIADLSMCGYLFWPTSSASAGPTTPRSAPGSRASRLCPAGSTPIADAGPSAAGAS